MTAGELAIVLAAVLLCIGFAALILVLSRVLDTMYFFAASIARAKGSIQSGLAPIGAGIRNAASIIS